MPHFPQHPFDRPTVRRTGSGTIHSAADRNIYDKWRDDRQRIDWGRTHVAGDRGRRAPFQRGLVERLLSAIAAPFRARSTEDGYDYD
ncbi:hypothetical protein [Sphingomonas sp. UYP23]